MKTRRFLQQNVWGLLRYATLAMAVPAPLARDTNSGGSDDANDSSSPLQVANFQDLSAVLSLLASDAVERKLSSAASTDWARMTTVWSLFGIIGVLRTYLKITFGLAGAETAGIDLAGAGGFTSQRTKGSLSSVRVCSMEDEKTWQDDTDRLLGHARSSHSPWVRPHIVVIGYAQCPFHSSRGRWQEVLAPVLFTIITTILTTFPAFLLVKSIRHPTHIELSTLVLLAGVGILSGSALPLLLTRLNPPGMLHLAEIDDSRFSAEDRSSAVIQPNDMVITSKTASSSQIIWQSRRNCQCAKRSADMWPVRISCACGALLILASYLFNYIVLGQADAARSYYWLGSQIAILMGRFVLWARDPDLFPARSQALLYAVTGSLTSRPISAAVPEQRIAPADGPRLDPAVVNFAIASAGSKIMNSAGGTGRIKYSVLKRLSETAPADLLCSEYVSIAEVNGKSEKGATNLHVVRLPWSFVEELYAAQNVILGNNPWALGGLYLAAVLENDEFIGLTTVHPLTGNKLPAGTSEAGRTKDGYLVDHLTYGRVGTEDWNSRINIEETYEEWHNKFRDNIVLCRNTARVNGPSHIEVHVWNYAPNKTASRTEPSLDLTFARDAARYARTKKHDLCEARHCAVLDFDPRS